MRYKCIGYNIDVIRQSACLLVNPVTFNNFAVLFNCMPVGRGSDSYDKPNTKLTIELVGAGPMSVSGPIRVQLCFSGVADAQGIFRCPNTLLLSSPHPCFITVFSLI